MYIEINKVIIDHFRGYREIKTFDFENDMDVVILSGSNGYGKTSVFDAIEWGFTGKLSRFEEPNEERNNSCFINYQPFEHVGKVCIEFGDKDQKYILTRESTFTVSDNTDYNVKKSTMWIQGKNIGTLYNKSAIDFLNELILKEEWRGLVEFSDIFSQYHILTQDKIKKFIQGLKAPDRYKQIATLVGTQKFYSYKSFFEKKSRVFKDNIEKLNKEKTDVQAKINNLIELSKDEIKINMVNQSFEEWIAPLIEKYNTIISEFSDKQFKIVKMITPIEMVTELKTHILQVTDDIAKNKSFLANENNKLLELKIGLENYSRYKSNFTIYKTIMPLVEKGYKLLRVQKQLPFYEEHDILLENIDINVTRTESSLNQIENYLFKLSDFNEQIDDLAKETSVGNFDKFENKLLQDLTVISNNIPTFVDDNKLIIKDNFISLMHYIQEIKVNFHQEINANNLVKTEINSFKEEIKKILNNVLGKEQEVTILEKKIVELRNMVNSLSTVEQELKNLLTETLKYLKNADVNLDNPIKCPVCDSNFVKKSLIEKIENKLIQHNETLSSMMKTLSGFEKQQKDLVNIITKMKSLYLTINADFRNKMDNIKNAISLLSELFRKEKSEYDVKIKLYNHDKLIISERYASFMVQINELCLPNKYNELKNEVEKQLNEINENLGYQKLKLESLQPDEILDNITNCNHQINIYEKKLIERGININNIEENLSYEINNNQSQMDDLNNINSDIKILEEKFNEVFFELHKSERLKELNNLQAKYIELNSLEQQYSQQLKIMDKLIEASLNAIQKISEKILTQHQDFISAIYKRINPHPLYTDVEFNFDKNSRGNDILNISCINKELTNKVNPAFTFSSAQVNTVAVSIFLGMALRQQCSNLRTILLDDPIQNMDDLNVISFIDILRNYLDTDNSHKKKQIIISTHDQDFYKIMLKKFRFINNKSFEFVGYNDFGPEIIYQGN